MNCYAFCFPPPEPLSGFFSQDLVDGSTIVGAGLSFLAIIISIGVFFWTRSVTEAAKTTAAADASEARERAAEAERRAMIRLANERRAVFELESLRAISLELPRAMTGIFMFPRSDHEKNRVKAHVALLSYVLPFTAAALGLKSTPEAEADARTVERESGAAGLGARMSQELGEAIDERIRIPDPKPTGER